MVWKRYQQLNKTDELSNYDNKYILFNFRFTLIETKFSKLRDYKKYLIKLLVITLKLQLDNLIVRLMLNIKKNNKIKKKKKIINLIINIKNNYKLDLKRTFDIYRGGCGKRADGLLIKNIFIY
ncbi:hypothetical protein [Spiroplasma citri]|uniref:hypothetical protein n=1 Tax=Spiroplasma citri TaxID=2133 RepID=UPI00286F2EBE|nr:hypothetical protein [Spiroplasma citri]